MLDRKTSFKAYVAATSPPCPLWERTSVKVKKMSFPGPVLINIAQRKTLPRLSASAHCAPVPLTHLHLQYRHKQAHMLLRTSCIEKLQSTGNLFLLPAAVRPVAATSRCRSRDGVTVRAGGKKSHWVRGKVDKQCIHPMWNEETTCE